MGERRYRKNPAVALTVKPWQIDLLRSFKAPNQRLQFTTCRIKAG